MNQDWLEWDLDLGLFVVADGMGGHNAGEVASHLAVEAIRDFVVESASGDLTWPFTYEPAYSPESNRLLTAVRLANRRIYEQGCAHTAMEGMGTTVVAVLAAGDQVALVSVGDSRIYRWRDGALEQMTNDDTWLATVMGVPDDSRTESNHPLKHVLTSVVGTREDLRPSSREEALQGRRPLRAVQRRHPWPARRGRHCRGCQGGRHAGAAGLGPGGRGAGPQDQRQRHRARHRGGLTGRILDRLEVRIIRVAGHVRRSFLSLCLFVVCAMWSACSAPTPSVPPAQSLPEAGPSSPASAAGRRDACRDRLSRRQPDGGARPRHAAQFSVAHPAAAR